MLAISIGVVSQLCPTRRGWSFRDVTGQPRASSLHVSAMWALTAGEGRKLGTERGISYLLRSNGRRFISNVNKLMDGR